MARRCLALLLAVILNLSLSPRADASICSAALAQAVTDGTPLKLMLKEGTEVEVEFLGFSPAYLASPLWASRMERQMDEVERFLNELAKDYPDGRCPICTVNVRPSGLMTMVRGRELLWHGGSKLTVRVPQAPFAVLSVSNDDNLRVKWNRGQMHSTKSIVSQRWKYLNPAAPFRLGLRHTLARVLKRLHIETSQLLDGGDRSSLHTAARKLILSQVTEPEALSQEARAALDQLDTPEQGEQFLRELTQVAQDQTIVQQIDARMEDAVRSMTGGTPGEPSESYAFSLLFAVANAHDIRIHLSVVNGELRTDVHSARQPLRVMAVGLFLAVATSDRVEVNIGGERAAGALAIDQALRRLAVR